MLVLDDGPHQVRIRQAGESEGIFILREDLVEMTTLILKNLSDIEFQNLALALGEESPVSVVKHHA